MSERDSNTANVSDAWKTKFDILQKIGADEQFIYKAMSSAEYKALGFREKNKISFNILAFLFGPLYYFSKTMWEKGAVILGTTWLLAALLTLVEVVVGVELPAVVYWIPSAVICAQLANYDYFRKVMHGEKMWRGMPDIFSMPVGAIGFPVVAFLLLIVISSGLFGSNVPKCGDSETVDLVKKIADGEMENQLGRAAADIFSYHVGAIRTTSINEQTGSHECSAQLGITASNTGETNEIPITYTVEITDDGEEFYVNVFGL